VKIEEIEYVEKNDKKYYKLKIDGKSFTAFDGALGFFQLKDGKILVGYDAKVVYTEKSSTYNNKPVTYRNIDGFEEIKEGKAEVTNTGDDKMTKNDWANKDRRITRMSCLARAIEFFELNKEGIANEVISEESVISLARKFETQYIYGESEE